MFNVTKSPEFQVRCHTWIAIGTIAAVVGVAATASGVAYTIYSSSNPPKTAKAASTALNKNQVQLGKLQTKQSQLSAAGKDTSSVDSAITKTNNSIAFLQSWISQHGDTLAPKTPDGNFAAITDPIGSKSNSGAPQPVTQTNWILIAGIAGAVLALGFLVYSMFSKKGK